MANGGSHLFMFFSNKRKIRPLYMFIRTEDFLYVCASGYIISHCISLLFLYDFPLGHTSILNI